MKFQNPALALLLTGILLVALAMVLRWIFGTGKPARPGYCRDCGAPLAADHDATRCEDCLWMWAIK